MARPCLINHKLSGLRNSRSKVSVMKSLKQEAAEFYDGLEAKGVHLAKFPCPNCGATLRTQLNETASVWDSLSTCTECKKSFMKITHPHCGVEAQIFVPLNMQRYELNGFVFNGVGDLISSPEAPSKLTLNATLQTLFQRNEYIKASRVALLLSNMELNE